MMLLMLLTRVKLARVVFDDFTRYVLVEQRRIASAIFGAGDEVPDPNARVFRYKLRGRFATYIEYILRRGIQRNVGGGRHELPASVRT